MKKKNFFFSSRATRTKATEMEVQSAHTKILLEAAETESKAFKVSHYLFI